MLNSLMEVKEIEISKASFSRKRKSAATMGIKLITHFLDFSFLVRNFPSRHKKIK